MYTDFLMGMRTALTMQNPVCKDIYYYIWSFFNLHLFLFYLFIFFLLEIVVMCDVEGATSSSGKGLASQPWGCEFKSWEKLLCAYYAKG